MCVFKDLAIIDGILTFLYEGMPIRFNTQAQRLQASFVLLDVCMCAGTKPELPDVVIKVPSDSKAHPYVMDLQMQDIAHLGPNVQQMPVSLPISHF